MNRRQKIVFIAALAVVTLMGIFPPWIIKFRTHEISVNKDVGYGLIVSPPTFDEKNHYENKLVYSNATIDFNRLLLQFAVIVILAGGLIYLFEENNGTGSDL